MLLDVDALRERGLVVFGMHRHHRLHDYGPSSTPSVTKNTVHPLNRTPYSTAGFCASTPGKAGQSAGWIFIMRSRKRRHHHGRQQPHETGADDEFDVMCVQRRDECGSNSSRDCERAMLDDFGRDTVTTRSFESPRRRLVGNHDANFGRSSRRSTASIIACRLVPSPEISTPSLTGGPLLPVSSYEGHAACALDERPDR